jgi:hypothetical protein
MPELITDPDRARRLARAIMSDINLYNPDKVQAGIENDNLFEAIEEELEEGRALYKARVVPEIFEKYNFYEVAIVDVLFKYTNKFESKIW